MAVLKCGAAVRYWKFVFDQKNARVTNATLQLGEFNVYDSLDKTTRTPIITQASEITLSNVVGQVETTAPLDVSSNPILDGAILIDGNTTTYAECTFISQTYPEGWVVAVDTGSVIAINSVEINVKATSLGSSELLYLTVYASEDGATYSMVDKIKLNKANLGIKFDYTLAGHGNQLVRIPVERGLGFIPGLVSEDSLVKKNGRVFCYQRDGMERVLETRTDENGNFTFFGLAQNRSYLVTAVDDDGTVLKQPVSWDHVNPALGHKTFTNFRDQDFINLYELTQGAIVSYFRPGTRPRDTLCIGSGVMASDRNYSEDPFDSGGYDRTPYNTASRGGLLAGTLTELRPNAMPLRTGNASAGNQIPKGFYITQTPVPASTEYTFFATLGLIGPLASSSGYLSIRGVIPQPSLYYGYQYGRGPDNFTLPNAGNVNSQNLARVFIIALSNNDVRLALKGRLLGDLQQNDAASTAFTSDVLHTVIFTAKVGDSVKLYIDGVEVLSKPTLGEDYFYVEPEYGVGNNVQYRNHTPTISSLEFQTKSNYFGTVDNTGNNDLNDFELAETGMIAKALTPAEVAQLQQVLTGSYTDATTVYNNTGFEAEVKRTVPTIYVPLDDTDISCDRHTWLPHRFPGDAINKYEFYPYTNAERYTFYGGTEYFSTYFKYKSTGDIILGGSMPGKARSCVDVLSTLPGAGWSAGNENLDNQNYGLMMGFSRGFSLIDTEERTLQIALYMDAHPPTGRASGIRFIGNTGDSSTGTTVDQYMNKKIAASIYVFDNGKVVIEYALHATSSTSVSYTFDNYIFPLSTSVLLHVTQDLNTNQAILYANGVQVDTQSVAAGYTFWGPVTAIWTIGSGTNYKICDIAAWPVRLSSSDIQLIAGAW